MFCKKCGKEIKEHSKFCTFCGSSQFSQADRKGTADSAEGGGQDAVLQFAESKEKAKAEKAIVIAAVLAGAAVVGVIFGASVWMRKNAFSVVGEIESEEAGWVNIELDSEMEQPFEMTEPDMGSADDGDSAEDVANPDIFEKRRLERIEEEVGQIQGWYYSAREQVNDGALPVDFGDGILGYYDYGDYDDFDEDEGRVDGVSIGNEDYLLYKVAVPAEFANVDVDGGMAREYYFQNGSLYFAFVFEDGIERRYYVKDGSLIRYIDENGDVYDSGLEAYKEGFDCLKREASNLLERMRYSYILPLMAVCYYDEDQFYDMDEENLYLARNELYARHGYMFKKEDLQQYFGVKAWYEPSRAEVPDSELNEYEKANLTLIQEAEARREED